MKDIAVIKIGGSTFGSRDTTIEDIVSLQKKGRALVVVHGGGSTVTDWLQRQGITTRFIRGERVTDLPALEVATAVLAGLANKEIAAEINLRGGRAVGISGSDGALIESGVKSPEMGYVGTVAGVNTAVLETLLGAGFMPVVAPISLYAVDRPADAPALLNVNGDPIAGEIAAAIGAARLVFLTEVEGIRDTSGKTVPRLSAAEAEAWIASGVIAGGMIPNRNACLRALKAGSIPRIIGCTQPHALLNEFGGKAGGTTITKE
jgi:acetylglutamate kinase